MDAERMNQLQQAIRDMNITRDENDASQPAKLRELAEIVEAANAMIEQHARFARDLGHSWAEIGDALGTSRQGAQQRFKSA